MSENFESLVDLIIAMLESGKSSYQFHRILRERKFNRYKKESVRVALSRLSQKGYVENSPKGWLITQKGREYYKHIHMFNYISSPFVKNSPQTILIAFDIKESDKVVRNWIRNQIKIFGYEQLQKSVWVGPGPIPKSFIEKLQAFGVRKYVEIFTIERKGK